MTSNVYILAEAGLPEGLVWSNIIETRIRIKSDINRTAIDNRKPILSIKRRSLYRNKLFK
jgi:hypothetical protein